MRTASHAFRTIAAWTRAIRRGPSGRNRHLASGFRRITPIPVHGASTSTLSKSPEEGVSGARERSWRAVRIPGAPVLVTTSRSMRSRRAETSVARISAFPPARADRCVVFPPGAAQASRIRSPGPGRSRVAINCAPSSMTRYAPSRNAASEKTGAGFPRRNPSGANRHGAGSFPSSANRLAKTSVATRNGFARTAKGGFSRQAARYARVSASPSDVASASIRSRGADPSAGNRRGSPSGGRTGIFPARTIPRRTALTNPPAPPPRAALTAATVSFSAARSGMRV